MTGMKQKDPHTHTHTPRSQCPPGPKQLTSGSMWKIIIIPLQIMITIKLQIRAIKDRPQLPNEAAPPSTHTHTPPRLMSLLRAPCAILPSSNFASPLRVGITSELRTTPTLFLYHLATVGVCIWEEGWSFCVECRVSVCVCRLHKVPPSKKIIHIVACDGDDVEHATSTCTCTCQP